MKKNARDQQESECNRELFRPFTPTLFFASKGWNPNTMMGDFCVLECHFLHRELRKSSFWVGKAMVNVHRAWHGSRRPKADDSLEILPGN